jgi:hypothetical protein
MDYTHCMHMFAGGGGGGGGSKTPNLIGGAGGDGGGSLWIEANTIAWGASSYVSANGADGAAGVSGNSGGGGGGSGGCCIVIYKSKSGTSDLRAYGGAYGADIGTGFHGGNGADGTKAELIMP